METPRFADVATFFRLPVVKDLNKLDYCIHGFSSWEALDRDYKEPLSAGRVHLVSETNYHTTDIIKNISSTPKGDPAYAGNCC